MEYRQDASIEKAIDEELKKIIDIFGISMAGKYRCHGAIEFAKALRIRFGIRITENRGDTHQ